MLVPLQGRNICYDLVGPESGQVVAFSHSLAADLGMWAEQVPALTAAGYRALRIDLRGHGGSSAPPAPYTIDALADDVITVMDAAGVDRCHFVGLSIGGMIGQSLGLRHGARMRSLMLCDTQTQSPADAATRWGPRIEAIKKAGSLEPITDATLERWFTADFRKNHAARYKQVRDSIVGCTPTGYTGCAQAIGNFNFTARLGSVKNPTLVVCGTDDPSAAPDETRKIAKLFPEGHYDDFPGAKHLPNVEQAEAFNRVLLGWIGARQ
jgi:3-oxoadipate enol-lactonase